MSQHILNFWFWKRSSFENFNVETWFSAHLTIVGYALTSFLNFTCLLILIFFRVKQVCLKRWYYDDFLFCGWKWDFSSMGATVRQSEIHAQQQVTWPVKFPVNIEQMDKVSLLYSNVGFRLPLISCFSNTFSFSFSGLYSSGHNITKSVLNESAPAGVPVSARFPKWVGYCIKLSSLFLHLSSFLRRSFTTRWAERGTWRWWWPSHESNWLFKPNNGHRVFSRVFFAWNPINRAWNISRFFEDVYPGESIPFASEFLSPFGFLL